ncbi:hypothetical protein, partial [Klebsiella pneumoniae]|uniref:hypothetical protein n=1 Tax=Klebsiella pneumoniae TaxID=573 RepID=UPI0019530818
LEPDQLFVIGNGHGAVGASLFTALLHQRAGGVRPAVAVARAGIRDRDLVVGISRLALLGSRFLPRRLGRGAALDASRKMTMDSL